MKKRLILSILFLTSIGVGIGLASSTFGVDDVFLADPALASKERASQAKIGNSVPSTEVDAAAKPTSPIEILETLNTLALNSLRPGWLHTRVERYSDTDSGNHGVFPNGTIIPNEQILDLWVHLNDELLVFESVTIMQTLDGQIVQVEVFSNGTYWNSALGEMERVEPFHIEGLDYQFLKDLKLMQEFGAQVEASTVILPDGSRGVQFITSDKFESPLESVDYEKPTTEAETRAVFGEDTGYLLLKEVVFWFEDGSERVFLRITQEIKFEVPPDDVMEFFAMKESEVGNGKFIKNP